MTTEPQNTPGAKTKGTPLPWEVVRGNFPADGEFDFGIFATINGKKYVIAEVFGRVAEDVRPDAEANADFIVRACNAHDDLVAALSECEAMMRGARAMLLKLEPNIKLEVHDAVAAQAVAALAKANGGAL